MIKRRRVLGLWCAAGLVLLLAIGAAGALVVHRRSLRTQLGSSPCCAGSRPFGVASARLTRLAPDWTNDGEVFLLLGESELKRGHREEALAAWAKLPPSSPFFGQASARRATELINTGRYSSAEDVLLQALADPGRSPRYELQRALSRLYRFEGRFNDVRRVLRGSWSRSPSPAALLKELWNVDHSPMPVESWGLALEKADGDDDRVWLGRANVAILTGRFAEAAPLLDRCPAGGPTTRPSGRHGLTWPWRSATWPASGRPRTACLPTALNRRQSARFAPGSPPAAAT